MVAMGYSVDVYNTEGKIVSKVELNSNLFAPVRVKNRDGRHLKFTAKFRSRWSTRRSWRAYLDRFPPSS